MQIEYLQQRLTALGAGPAHSRHVLRLWLAAKPPDSGKRRPEDFLPRSLRDGLPALQAELDALLTLRSAHPAEDGSERLLLALADGQTVESVLLPRGGLCVSSQVGCAVGCVFCMTGQGGLVRQLGSAEIVAQVALARSRRAVHKVVFMGMGEPAHNLDAVMDAIQLLGTVGGIGHKNLVLSTVGDPRVFERFARLGPAEVKPALALSLHTSHEARRATLLPNAPRMAPEALMAAADDYARRSAYPVQVQWTLLAGVNDGDDEIEGIVGLFRGRHAMLNLIPYNAVDGLAWQRPTLDRARELVRVLHRRGVLTKLRWSAAQDVEGGCGQLRARAAGSGVGPGVKRSGRSIPVPIPIPIAVVVG